jgi:hypothetical protein
MLRTMIIGNGFSIYRTRVIPPSREVSVIMDHHQGILKAVELTFPGMLACTTDGA